MIKKRKKRKKKVAKAQQFISQHHATENFQEVKTRRYSRKYLTLVLMGGAAFFALKGCNDVDNDGDGVFYWTIQECVQDNNNFSVCADAWINARQALYADLPE